MTGRFETINEKISVTGIYQNTRFTPHHFTWNQRDYPIHQITLVSDTKDGGVKKRYYSVVSKGNLYRLCFNRDTETWILEEIWSE